MRDAFIGWSDPGTSGLDMEFFSDEEDIGLWPGLPAAGTNPIDTSQDEKVISRQEDEQVGPSSGSRVYPAPCRQPRYGPNRIPKGCGRDARANSPDPWDFYDYQKVSPGFRCIRDLGYEGIVLRSLWQVLKKVEAGAELLTHRNRAARRRKPCAFHWLDENWPVVKEIYKAAVQEVLGNTSGRKPRGRKPKQTFASKESSRSNL
jgi:hypothetical protein